MWTLMPSSAINTTEQFFRQDDLKRLADAMNVAFIKGRVWGGEERGQAWSVECDSFEDFNRAVAKLAGHIELLAFDEMCVDDDTLRLLQDDLYRLAEEDGTSNEAISKAVSAMRSHENELYAVVAYAFLSSGRVIFVRAQNELARFVYHPDRLLSNEGLSAVRKLKTLIEH